MTRHWPSRTIEVSGPRTAPLRVALAACALLGGCVDGTGDPEALPAADYELFVDDVQPVFSEACSEAACHGTPSRPLGLYAVGAARLDADTADDDPLTEDELRANYQRARSFSIGIERPSESLLIRKPLAVSEGGVVHEPGPVFESTVDHRHAALSEWLEAALAQDEDGGA